MSIGKMVNVSGGTDAELLFGVPTHAIDLLTEMRARGARHLGAVRGFRISGAPADAARCRAHALRYRAAERLGRVQGLGGCRVGRLCQINESTLSVPKRPWPWRLKPSAIGGWKLRGDASIWRRPSLPSRRRSRSLGRIRLVGQNSRRERDSLITPEISLIADLNSLQGRKKFPVRMLRELACKALV